MTDVAETLRVAKTVRIPVSGTDGFDVELALPDKRQGIVLIADGGGNCRLSPRSRYVARLLRERGFCTLLVDTRTALEQEGSASEADAAATSIDAARRILLATDWIGREHDLAGLPVGYLASDDALCGGVLAAADRPDLVQAVVLRGTVPESAMDALPRLKVPTLLIAGSHDTASMDQNRVALERLGSTSKHLEIVPGTCHSFEEPGTLAAASLHAAQWFKRFLVRVDVAVVDPTRAFPEGPPLSGDR